MKRIAIVTALLILILFAGLASLVQAETLIAHYPLNTDGVDSTANNADMLLYNVPFEDGGIYCNGVYSGPDSCKANTPTLAGLDFASFAISAEFKVDEYPAEYTPVFMGGSSYRWMGVYLNPNGTVVMKYNNSDYEMTTAPYSLDTWHEAKITYNAGAGNLYLDGILAANVVFAIDHGDNRNIGIKDRSSGDCFKGWFKNLKVYGEVCDPRPLYPTPDQNALNMATTKDEVSIWSSGPLSTSSVNTSSFTVSGNMSGSVPGTVINESAYSHKYDLSDAFDFHAGEVVTATLTDDVQCYDGTYLTNGFQWQFTCEVDPNSPGDVCHYRPLRCGGCSCVGCGG